MRARTVVRGELIIGTAAQHGVPCELIRLTRLINQLSSIEGIRVFVGFVNEPSGPSWTVHHNGWADAAQIYIKVNVGAAGFKPEQLEVPVNTKKPALR